MEIFQIDTNNPHIRPHYPLSFTSCSIVSSPSDILPRKRETISKTGFISSKLSFPNMPGQFFGLVHEVIANEIQRLFDIDSEPLAFCNSQGWKRGSAGRKDAFARARRISYRYIFVNGWGSRWDGWLMVLYVGSIHSPTEKISISRESAVSDLREPADMLTKYNFRMRIQEPVLIDIRTEVQGSIGNEMGHRPSKCRVVFRYLPDGGG
ncbi:J domain-containing protein [Penicillium atrosanguineum]|uniref:J domain-containing protein n=1 Tax=Penicillium atrosanguineum TaxID=1132637 RepID=UPI002389F0F5|nr:J domain-containing protein [Penicillium atrosanguineum]KAJ5125721.1 hypothetical protein N7526_007898 [Penicillium atrosanguineum]KAJ5292815.1 J domain-containing protein [Penicillium atrosanguineum]